MEMTLGFAYSFLFTKTLFTTAIRRSVIPKVQTIAAPVGRSHRYEKAVPARLTPIPTNQPTKRAALKLLVSRTAQTAGTIRKEKIRSTPATWTELVTTQAKER